MSKPRTPTNAQLLPSAVTEAIALALEPAPLNPGLRNRMRQRVVQQAREAAPEGTVTARADDTEWVAITSLLEFKVLRRDEVAGNQTVLMRMQPGGVMYGHRHTVEEEFFILEGECHIGTHRLSAGDIHTAAVGSWHDAITTQGGVLVLLRGEYPPPMPSLEFFSSV